MTKKNAESTMYGFVAILEKDGYVEVVQRDFFNSKKSATACFNKMYKNAWADYRVVSFDIHLDDLADI